MKLLSITAIILLTAFPASASENIRVAIADNQGTVTLQSSAGLLTEGAPGKRPEKKITVRASSLGNRPLSVQSPGGSVAMNGRRFRGRIELRRKPNGLLLVINELDIEDYLRGVIAAEIPHEWEMEALKAQAVASRTYALYQKKNAGKRSYHILATVDSQVYLGKPAERPRATQAVEETEGLVLLHGGGVIPAFYHSSCGGHTEDALELWGIDAPYLKGVDCDCQQISKYGLWEKRFAAPDVITALRKEGYLLGAISNVAAGDITPAGRVKNVVFRTARGTTSVPAEALRAALGYSHVPSIFFEPELIGNELVVSGRGLGHGVGLCQWGAQDMARKGHDFKSILAHYYPGAKVQRRSGR